MGKLITDFLLCRNRR